MLYYPGELQVRLSLPSQAKKARLRGSEVKVEDVFGRYEKHAEYPRNCDNSYWTPGLWANIYQDLRDHLFENSEWDVPSLSCLDRFATNLSLLLLL